MVISRKQRFHNVDERRVIIHSTHEPSKIMLGEHISGTGDQFLATGSFFSNYLMYEGHFLVEPYERRKTTRARLK